MEQRKANSGKVVAQLAATVSSLSKKVGEMNISKKPSKSARKRSARKARKSFQSKDNSMAFQPKLMPVVPGATDTGLRRLRLAPRSGLSDSGISFLKCAFAPPDFQATSVNGVPDDYRSVSLTRKHRLVGPVSFTALTDYYILLLPTPGIAYWVATTVSGVAPVAATTWTGVNYADFATMFGSSGTAADQVTKFRFISNHIEIIPTVNQMVWSGNIQAWKIPVTIGERLGGANFNDTQAPLGLAGVLSTLANQFSGPYISGIYSACYSANSSFIFQSIQEGITTLPNTLNAADFGGLASTNGFPGLDNEFESLVIKISGVTATETALIKTWSCVEYQVSPNSVLYEFQSFSSSDKLAMELYREIICNLPVGVPYDMNDTFWQRVLNIISQISGVTSLLPGPYGLASRGVNMISNAGLQFLK
jgi:hypothetical protein